MVEKTSVFARIPVKDKKAFYQKVRSESAATPSAVIRRMIEMYLKGEIKV